MRVPFYLLVLHDASKFRLDELLPHARAYASRDSTKKYADTPEFRMASCLHHHRNKHHWQYWIDLKDSGDFVLIEMPDKYFWEMVADWCASAEARKGSVVEWWLQNQEHVLLHPNTKERLEIE